MGYDSISSLLSSEDLAKISAAVLGDDSAMDDIPFFSPAGAGVAVLPLPQESDARFLALRRGFLKDLGSGAW